MSEYKPGRPVKPKNYLKWKKKKDSSPSQLHHNAITMSSRQRKRMDDGNGIESRPSDYERRMDEVQAQRMRAARWRTEDLAIDRELDL